TACSGKSVTSEHQTKDEMKTEQTASKTSAAKGKEVADFELMGVDGKTYRLSDYKGKKVYLKFWASLCSICLASLPDTDEIAKEAGDDYVVLTVVSPGHKGEQSEA
ncbi:TlpA family protein disulfide reductase, partial [Klebsiella pneumoniae]|nr:TlpA family protein disulfide reductase [Klebsiella pneumoniae]